MPLVSAHDSLYTACRPQVHFTPEENWMNDPNGLVFHDGEYHLYYQYNPYGNTWGHMSWGHATSSDLVAWEHHRVAIPERKTHMVFSGSAVVDRDNTSGLCPEGETCLLAYYTYATETIQNQWLAVSTDKGYSYTDYSDNPLIDLGKRDFRDPKVFWYAPEEKWVMVVALPKEYKILFYESKDGLAWKRTGEFGNEGQTTGIWECPDMFPLQVENEPEGTKWVLLVSGPGPHPRYNGMQYWVGDFDGKTFSNNNSADKVLWLDYGKDFFAGVSYNNVPDDRRIMIGWANSWVYGQKIPTSPWRSMMSIPRELSLYKYPDGIRLKQHIVREMENYLQKADISDSFLLNPENSPMNFENTGKTYQIDLEVKPEQQGTLEIELLKSERYSTKIRINFSSKRIIYDRSNSGYTDFDPAFAKRDTIPFPSGLSRNTMDLSILVDECITEIFINEGELCITNQVFPFKDCNSLSVSSSDGAFEITHFKVSQINKE